MDLHGSAHGEEDRDERPRPPSLDGADDKTEERESYSEWHGWSWRDDGATVGDGLGTMQVEIGVGMPITVTGAYGETSRLHVSKRPHGLQMGDGWGGRSTSTPAAWSTPHRSEETQGGKPTEKMVVPEFDGEGGEYELGTTARSYLRKVSAWLRCTRLPEPERALALYTHLKGRAWVFAEELDIDKLGAPGGVEYYLEWVRVRFMEMEVNKVAAVMTELFKKCRRAPEQTVREFNMSFERLLLRLGELNCELPSLVKAWLYLDRLRLGEGDELALLASVGTGTI